MASVEEIAVWEEALENAENEIKHLRRALVSIAGKQNPSVKYCQDVAKLAIAKSQGYIIREDDA